MQKNMKKTTITFILPFLLFGMLMEMCCTKGMAIQTVGDNINTKWGFLLLRKKEKSTTEKKKKNTSSMKAEDISDSATQGTQASDFLELSAEDVVKSIGTLFTADQKKTGILASVSMAQFILESGYGKSELAQNANNLFGMKCALSGNDWAGSTWDGTNKYTKETREQCADGSHEIITADFRKYLCIEDSIADHSAYLLGAKNGNELRYYGLKDCTDYKKAIRIIKDGGYTEEFSYVQELCSIIERYNLTQFDVKKDSTKTKATKSNKIKKIKNVRKKQKHQKSKKIMKN